VKSDLEVKKKAREFPIDKREKNTLFDVSEPRLSMGFLGFSCCTKFMNKMNQNEKPQLSTKQGTTHKNPVVQKSLSKTLPKCRI
jgi:hypothetical protein